VTEKRAVAVAIVDYGMGNLHSVHKAFERLGVRARIVDRPEDVAAADRLVLPGVGAMADAMSALRLAELIEPIRAFVRTGKPFLGVCLGMQMLFDRSLEDGVHEGLGLLPGEVVRFDTPRPLKVPHMGWNRLTWLTPAPIRPPADADGYMYFVHSYYVRPSDPADVAATADYGGPFAAVVWRDNVVATQFHPEKSQTAGLSLLQRFAEM
jgi:glutamine amidotransferase